MKEHNDLTTLSVLKAGIWLYLLLLLFEGALRKWVLPGLADPLLVIRDPIALGLLAFAIYHKVMRWNGYLLLMVLISIVAIPGALLLGHGNLYVTLFGARYLLIHFPFIFLIGSVFDKSDVEKFGRFILWLTPVMAVLIALQFYSPQSAWVNRGIGGSELGSGFPGAMGYYRPAGLFSFTSGVSTYFSLATAYVIYFWLSKASANRLLLLAASVGVLAAIPFSISRAYLFQFVITVFFGMAISLSNPRVILRVAVAVVVMVVAYIGLQQLDAVKTSTTVLAARFEGATKSEGGLQGTLGNRFILGELYHALTGAAEHPFLGYGLGIGTNTGQRLLAGDRYLPFVSTEGEWNRIINEVGPVLGLLIVGIRLMLAISLLLRGWLVIRNGNLLPWLLMSVGFLQIATANWAQPTSLGFSVAICGLVWAGFNQKDFS